MKRKIAGALVMVFLISIALLAGGCSNKSTGNSAQGKVKTLSNIVIGITQNNAGVDSYETTYEQTFEAEAKSMGVKAIVLDPGGDVDKQVDQVQDLIEDHVDVIIVWPTNGKALVPAVKKAYDAGIPVVITNTELDPSGNQYITAYTGPDNVTQGKEAGEMLVEALGGKGKIVEITGTPGYATAIERDEGFRDAINGQQGIQVLDSQPANWNREQAQTVMEDFLTKYPDIDGVYSEDDDMGVGALNAIKARGLAGKIKITGSTLYAVGYDEIKAGDYYGSVYQSPVDDAKMAFQTAVDIALGKQVQRFNYINTPKVTQANISQFARPAF